MGGARITFRNLTVSCGRAGESLINSNLFIKESGRSTTPPTDVVCVDCTFGGGAAHTVEHPGVGPLRRRGLLALQGEVSEADADDRPRRGRPGRRAKHDQRLLRYRRSRGPVLQRRDPGAERRADARPGARRARRPGAGARRGDRGRRRLDRRDGRRGARARARGSSSPQRGASPAARGTRAGTRPAATSSSSSTPTSSPAPGWGAGIVRAAQRVPGRADRLRAHVHRRHRLGLGRAPPGRDAVPRARRAARDAVRLVVLHGGAARRAAPLGRELRRRGRVLLRGRARGRAPARVRPADRRGARARAARASPTSGGQQRRLAYGMARAARRRGARRAAELLRARAAALLPAPAAAGDLPAARRRPGAPAPLRLAAAAARARRVAARRERAPLRRRPPRAARRAAADFT